MTHPKNNGLISRGWITSHQQIAIPMWKYDFFWKDQIQYTISESGAKRGEGGLAINSIKIFQNGKALAISVGNSYSEDQLMHNFLDNLHQGR